MWLAVLSDQLPIIATVGRYPTVKLIGRRPLPGWLSPFITGPLDQRSYAELPTVSHGYPPPRGRLPTCYAPVRRVSAPKNTPLDLHALGTPPALILSQDQTLHQSMMIATRHSRARPPRPSRPAETGLRLRCCLAADLLVAF